ncbi:histidine kinase 3-like [Nymphaea colorata]|nr:histidine kinase 3-like [Nymphaea colorata]
MSFLGVLWVYITMVGLHLRKWLRVLCLSIVNWNLAKEIMGQKVGGFGGAGKLGIKWWRRVVGEDWKSHHISKSMRSLKLEEVPGKKLLVMWTMSGILGSLWIFWYINSLALQGRKEMLANMCDERARMLQDQFNVSMNHVHSLAILVSTFHHGKSPSAIDQKTFAKYTEKTAFERPLTSGVAYAQRVLHAEREQFEKEHGWTIKVMDEKRQNPVSEDKSFAEVHETSPIQEEYAPVVFAQDTLAHVVSIDMLSGKEDRDNILRARASGRGVLTAPFGLLKSRRLGVILTFAAYSKELPSNATPQERIEATKGYIGGIFDVESLVEKLLQQLASKQAIYVSVYDTTNTSDPISMYGLHFVNDGPHHISPLHFGDPLRKHEMRCRFKQKPSFPWLAMTSSLGFLLIILLIGHVVHAAFTRVVKVVRDFHEMMELKARAEAADIAKSQFLATVSHEIRTPMNGVLGMLQMLMDTDLDETQLDYVKTAQASGKALVSLINEVLDQAKIESGKLELEAVQFDLRSLLDDIVSLFCGKSQDKGIELAAYVSDKVPDILIGDPGRLRQIITNLVDNSIKFTEKGHIFVSVQPFDEVKNLPQTVTKPLSRQFGDCNRNGCSNSYDTLSGFPVVERRRSWEKFSFNMDRFMNNQSLKSNTSDFINLLVSVEDTGIGIPLEAQARVFTPFMQADSSTSRIHGGTGIGLSISKCLVDLMNGEIGLASEYHIGSTFTFTAVFARGKAKLNGANDPKQQYRQDYVMPELQRSIAVVVDPRSVRAKVTKYHLQRLGIQAEICSDLSQGLAKISHGEKEINLFVVDEEELVKQDRLFSAFSIDKARKDAVFNQIKFFLLSTSVAPTKTRAQFLKKYPLTVIMKPLRASMLSACFQRVMGVQKKGNCCHGDLPLSSLKSILHGKWILVVDDNAVNLRVAAGALKKYGANVECTESGKEAVMVLKPPHKFDACFMDVQMPEMDGFEATRRIRVMEADINDRIQRGELSAETYGHITYWHVPILAMTADVIYATHEDCRRSGMDGYVSKPFEESQLYEEVARFFETNSTSD